MNQTSSIDPRPTRDSQSADSEAQLRRHGEKRVEYIGGLLNPPDVRGPGYFLVAILLALILLVAFGIGPLPTVSSPDCDAKPGPGINWDNCNFPGLVLRDANLAGASLRNANLAGASVPGAKLSSVDLAYSNLSASDLSHANLSRASLVGANLQNSDLTYALLEGADLSYADLSGARIAAATLVHARLDRAIWWDGTICQVGSVEVCIVENGEIRR